MENLISNSAILFVLVTLLLLSFAANVIFFWGILTAKEKYQNAKKALKNGDPFLNMAQKEALDSLFELENEIDAHDETKIRLGTQEAINKVLTDEIIRITAEKHKLKLSNASLKGYVTKIKNKSIIIENN